MGNRAPQRRKRKTEDKPAEDGCVMLRALVPIMDHTRWKAAAEVMHAGNMSAFVRDRVNSTLEEVGVVIRVTARTADRMVASGKTPDQLINEALDRDMTPTKGKAGEVSDGESSNRRAPAR